MPFGSSGPKASGGMFRSTPPDPNRGQLEPQRSQAGSVSHQPAPAVVASASHVTTHVLPRRFIGGMPESVAHSDEAQAKHEKLRGARQEAIRRLAGGVQDAGRRGSKMVGDKRRSLVATVRIKRRGQGGEEYEEDVDLKQSSDDEDEPESSTSARPTKKKKKKKRKDVWVGESFDIGREFLSGVDRSHRSPGRDAVSTVNTLGAGPSNYIAQDPPRARPTVSSRQTTQESFVTARTHASFANQSQTSLDRVDSGQGNGPEGYDLVLADPPRPSGSFISEPVQLHRNGHSGSSSLAPLIGMRDPPSSSKGKKKATYPDSKSSRATPNLRARLKSAIRRPSNIDPLEQGNGVDLNEATNTPRGKSKTVQFPVELEHHIQEPQRRVLGDQAPADPGDVLAREGDETAGTSFAAAEEAMEEEEEEEEASLPAQVIMRDRMLVRVGYHREDDLTRYDEAMHRRKPCSRLEPLEEYLVVWRRGSVEFYQDWSVPLKERIKGHKRLCYLVPLSPTRSHLSVFNETDMTLCLTTSADKLSDDMDHYLRSQSTRTSTMKDRVKQSKQAQWLRKGKRGTHVFIMKIAERSRAMDWYWEVWRELGGELPRRIDIAVPSFSTSVRLPLPDDEDMVGSRSTCTAFSPKNTVKTSYDMVSETVDMEALLQQRSAASVRPDLQLAWKSADGNLDWVCWSTTVEGRSRDWALLAGVAKQQAESSSKTLQIREATHRPRTLRLEDGSMLEEPPGVEGYLVRHTGGASPKESVYLSVFDGCVYIALRNTAVPPLKPAREGSSPADLFPEIHQEFLDSERRRSSAFIEHSTGCVDLRTVENIKTHTASSSIKLKRPKNCFDVTMAKGAVSVFEAQSPENAQEWVDRIGRLASYWKRRHRVDARSRMDAMALQAHEDPFAGTGLGLGSEALSSDLWDWCVIDGCRPICLSGRLFVRKGKWTKFRSRLFVLTGGCLISFKVKVGDPLHQRKQRYPLFGAYTYSGMLAQDELHEAGREDAFASRARVYQDGLQSSDGLEDCTFCVRLSAKPSSWGKNRTQPWERYAEKKWATMPLSTAPPFMLIFRTRSKLERDRWIWAINAEMERQVRGNIEIEQAHKHCGDVP